VYVQKSTSGIEIQQGPYIDCEPSATLELKRNQTLFCCFSGMEKYAFFPFAAKPWDMGQVSLTPTIKELNCIF
jgi:hypothetical protein